MLHALFFAVIAGAIGTMLYALVLAVRLRKVARGGKVGRVVSWLIGFVAVFTAGYLSGPFFPYLPADLVILIAAFVFLFGAIFVIIVLRMIGALTQQVFEQLDKV
jgi:hypothetical protein